MHLNIKLSLKPTLFSNYFKDEYTQKHNFDHFKMSRHCSPTPNTNVPYFFSFWITISAVSFVHNSEFIFPYFFVGFLANDGLISYSLGRGCVFILFSWAYLTDRTNKATSALQMFALRYREQSYSHRHLRCKTYKVATNLFNSQEQTPTRIWDLINKQYKNWFV